MTPRLVPVTALRSTQSPQKRVAAVVTSAVRLLRRCGWTDDVPPITVMSYSDGEYIVDGHHRAEAAQRAGLTHVPVVDVTAMSRGDRVAHKRKVVKYRALIRHPLAACPIPRRRK